MTGSSGGRLTAAQAAAIRRALEAGRAGTLDQIESLRRDFDGIVASAALTGADDEHDPEGATIAFERAQLETLIAQARQQLLELEDALARLERGGYGICEGCGQPIAAERLEVRPTARTCISCAAAHR
jgi:RNA polymerase-binding transcription factor